MSVSELLIAIANIELEFLVLKNKRKMGLVYSDTTADYNVLELQQVEPTALGMDFIKAGGVVCQKVKEYVESAEKTIRGFSRHFYEGVEFGYKELNH